MCRVGEEVFKCGGLFMAQGAGVGKVNDMRCGDSQRDGQMKQMGVQFRQNAPSRKVQSSIHVGSRVLAPQIIGNVAYVTSGMEGNKVEMLLGYLERIGRLDQVWLRGPSGYKDECMVWTVTEDLR
uniref:Uncharacterized protein n=1 Tax=Magnetospirillum gryphiswaldense TaxID=55518 RepID=A4U3B5_9PROT|nr:conserved hypothetical protein [Magnetospirillum gryphiswaldense MSR-1]